MAAGYLQLIKVDRSFWPRCGVAVVTVVTMRGCMRVAAERVRNDARRNRQRRVVWEEKDPSKI